MTVYWIVDVSVLCLVGACWYYYRIQGQISPAHVSAEREYITGVLEQRPHWGSGAESLIRGWGANCPEAERLITTQYPRSRTICPKIFRLCLSDFCQTLRAPWTEFDQNRPHTGKCARFENTPFSTRLRNLTANLTAYYYRLLRHNKPAVQ